LLADGTDGLVQGNLVAAGLDAQSMQHIARWLNLSETTFVLPPTVADADYRLRIFTPANELPFAGHPTLGSAHAVVTIRGRVERGSG
jgi:PhzF family phenazine biosynthesis protein